MHTRACVPLANKGNQVFDAVALARKLGAPLIRVRKQGSTYDLDFVHRSAYQYLADSQGGPPGALPLILRPQGHKQHYRGIFAMWHFTDCPDSLKNLQTLREEAFQSRWHLTSERHFEMHYGLIKAFQYILRQMNKITPVLQETLSLIRQLGGFTSLRSASLGSNQRH